LGAQHVAGVVRHKRAHQLQHPARVHAHGGRRSSTNRVRRVPPLDIQDSSGIRCQIAGERHLHGRRPTLKPLRLLGICVLIIRIQQRDR
jgi:hypothetical protein